MSDLLDRFIELENWIAPTRDMIDQGLASPTPTWSDWQYLAMLIRDLYYEVKYG